MSIFLSGIEINRVSDTKFLGVIISSNLTWNKHIDVVHSKFLKPLVYFVKFVICCLHLVLVVFTCRWLNPMLIIAT